jgi:hypothetical protein
MIKDLEIFREFHSFAKGDDDITYRKYYMWMVGEHNGKKRQTMVAIKETDPILPWIEVLYKRLVEDFEQEPD